MIYLTFLRVFTCIITFLKKSAENFFKSYVSMELVLRHFSIEMVKIMKGLKLSLKLLKLDLETLHIRYLLRLHGL